MKPFRGDKTLGLAIRQVFAAVERESKFEACSRLAFRMHVEGSFRWEDLPAWPAGKSAEKRKKSTQYTRPSCQQCRESAA